MLALPQVSEAGDPIAASRRLRERAGSLTALPDAGTGITRDVGAIAIVEHDGSDYSKLEPDGTPNYAARARVTQRFYEAHGDLYDFVVVFTNFEFDTGDAVAFHSLVRNDVSGIGLPPVNNGPLFGSPGRLKGYVDMGFVGQYRLPPFSMQAGAPGFADAVNVLAHEVGHQWLARIRYRTPAGSDSTDLLGLEQSHWSYLLDSDASLLYGSDWTPVGAGVFQAERVRQGYSSLDLYLMGLLDPTRVAPFALLRNPSISASQLPQEGATVTAVPETIAIDQVVAAEAARQPDHQASQKDFRIGFLFLAAPGLDPTTDDLDAVDRLREAFSNRFFALTRGVAFADTTLAEEPLPPPGPPADLDRALAWLRSRQALDGRWEDSDGTALRETAAVLAALDAAADTGAAYQRGQSWLAGADATNLDFVARRARGRVLEELTPAARGELIAAIWAYRNVDGGFAAGQGYESDGFDTALALSALHDLGAPADARVRGSLAALGALQAPAGGWALVPGREPSTMATAQVLLALHDWSEVPEAAALIPSALTALLSRQNADGGFGESPSTAHGTALAMLALDAAAAPAAVIDPASEWLQRTQLAEGSWSGRVYETALTLAALKGRTAPNLVVRQDDLTLDPPHPEEGTVVEVRARVRNVGRLASSASVVRLYDGTAIASNAVDEAPLAALGPGEDALVTLELDTTGRPGTHLLSVKADADEVVSEVREDDNTASRSIEVDGPMADLAIRVSDIVVTPYPPEAGETVQVAVTVTNRGDRDASSTQLRLVRGDPGAGGVAVGQADLPALGPGSSITATFDWLASGTPGTTSLVAVADATFSLAESDETNNQAALPVTLTGPTGPGPDLEVPLVEAEPPVLAQLPQAVSVRIVVRNLGRDPVESSVALLDGTAASGGPITELPITLPPRSGTVLVVPFEVTTPGSRTLTAVADRAALVEETNEDNNQAFTVVTDPGNTLDVAIASVVPSAAELTIGETLSVAVTVRNRGTMPLAHVPVILAHAATSLAELDRELVTLPPGASAQLTLNWTTSFTGEAVPLAVVADPFELLVETDEGNNRQDITVRVQPSERPNLKLTGADIAFEPDPPLEGGSTIVHARIENPSPVDAGPFAVRFFRGNPDAGGVLVAETAVPGVVGQAAAIASITWSPVDTNGTQGMFVVADAEGQVDEYDEADNVGFRPFDVVGLPDLTLASADLTLTPPFPREGENVAVAAVVRNLGARRSDPSTLRVFEGEPAGGTLLAEMSIPSLAPGEYVSLASQWTPSGTGETLVSAIADADGVVAEADEGNNLGRRAVVVQDADLYTTAPFFSPDGDGVQDETTLAYRTTGPVDVIVSNARGRRVRTLAENAPAEGSQSWDGRDDHGRLLSDGKYSLTLRSLTGGVLGRLDVVLDTNRSAIHDAAGTGLVALRTLDATQANGRGPAWMPAEDEVLLIVPADNPIAGFTQGLLRWRLDGARSYVSADAWYDPLVQFASGDAVSPDGREVLVTKDGEVVAVDLVTGLRRTVGPGNRAEWSPDGTRILIGAEIYARDGTLVVSLPLAYAQWSPDGQHLIGGLDIIRRDGTQPRQVPLPVEVAPEEMLGEPCFAGTFWRGDGPVILHIGRWTAHDGENIVITCDPDRLFAHDLDSGESREILPLRGAPRSHQWSPDGSRLLHGARTGAAHEVTREMEGPGLQLWPSSAWSTPRSTGAFFCEAGPEGCLPYVARLAVITNLMNLTADLTAVPLPANNGILLKGTVSDANLDRWQLDFADTSTPITWHPIGAASSVPVVDSLLAAWVPSQPGTYLVRLVVWDRAGGRRLVSRSVTWDQTPALANITQTERLISPNGDGFRDDVRFDFLVQEPTRLEARVHGPEPPVGAPGHGQDVRRFSLDLPVVGPSTLVWDGRDESGHIVADGRYTVYLNEVPFPVEVDATPPEIGISHDNLRLASSELMESPGEFQSPTGGCASAMLPMAAAALDRHWHVVDPNLKLWTHGIEWGNGPIYEPERDLQGQIVYVGGVPKVLRADGRPVDTTKVVGDPFWPATLTAEDLIGNVSSLASAPVPPELFVVGARPMPRCLPESVPLPKTVQVGDGPVTLAPRTRFFVKVAPFDAGLKRFEYRATDTAPWSAGPMSSLPHASIVDVDLLGLGLMPGPLYRGRFVDSGSSLVSDEFPFRLCTQSAQIEVAEPEPIPGTGQARYTVTLEADVPEPLSVASLVVKGSGALQNFALQAAFDRVGPTTYRKVVVAPIVGCSLTGGQSLLSFESILRDANGAPLAHDGACLSLRRQVGRCDHHLVITEERLECSAASPDRVVLRVEAQSPDPTARVSLFRDAASPAPVASPYAIGIDHVCGTLPGPSGLVPLYCDDRLVTADVTGVPDGMATFTARLDSEPPAGPLAESERDVQVDRRAPVLSMSEPPEGAVACVEGGGPVENVRLAFRVDDAAPDVAPIRLAYRGSDEVWHPLCLDQECGPWDGLPTGSNLEKLWDVRGLADGEYELLFEVCDHSGNTAAFTRRISITRGGTAIGVLPVVNQDFSPNGDARADEAQITFRLPQTLRLQVDVHASTVTGPVVRRLADQQFSSGDHAFVWNGLTDAGPVAADGRYFVVGKGTNACGGTASTSAWAHLDTEPPVADISSPAPGAVIETTTDVLGRAADPRFASYALAFGPGAAPSSWTPVAGGVNPVGTPTAPGLLGVFQPPATQGLYTLRLVARDRALNETETLSPVNVGPRAFLERFTVSPDVFSPNGDGRRDTATIEYELLIAGRVTLEVRDGTGALLRVLESSVDRVPGTYTVVWDGWRGDGTTAPEGTHRVWIHVEDPLGVASPQDQAVLLALDVAAPSVALTHPLAASFATPDQFVHGSVTDSRLREYVIKAERPFAPTIELARGTQGQIDVDLAPLVALTDGPYQLVVTAEDMGENRTELRVPFTVDATDPQAFIQAPAPGTVLAGGSTPVIVTGLASDAHFESYELSFGPGTAPAFYVSITTGTQTVSGGTLGSWNPVGLPDGPYVLRLVVTDRAGRAAESRSAIVLDSRMPDAVIESPAAEAYLNASMAVTGTASDANLESWRLEAAPGESATAFQWSLLAEGHETVIGGALADWALLPPDGRHTLRLTVADRVGQVSKSVRTVNVDTTPPGPPGTIASIVRRESATIADVVLTWPASVEPDVAGYALTRDGVAVASGPIAVTTFTDENLPEGSYEYHLRAVDRAGNVGPSGVHQVQVDLTPPVVALLQPAEGARVSGSVEVRGTAFSLDDFAGFRLLVGEGSAPTVWTEVQASTVPVSAGVLGTWTPLQPGPHVLALEAEDQFGNQARVAVSVLVDHTPPAAPVLLSVLNVPASDALTSTWQPSGDPEVIGYLVYRNSRLANAPAVVIGDLRPYLVPGPSYEDGALPDGAHCYQVLAMDEAGNLSPPSNEVCRSLDNRPPHATLVEPPDGTRFEFPIRLVAATPDLDVTSVRFEVTREAPVSWTPIGSDSQPPYEATLDPQTLMPGSYQVRAVATEIGGEQDPMPSPITLIYGDATAPAPPAGLAAAMDGHQVTLAWSPGTEPDLAGYHVYRDGERLTPVPQPLATHSETLPLGSYEYAVTAIDADGNESTPSSVDVRVYRLTLDPVVPPVTGGPVTLTGRGGHGIGTVEIVRAGTTIAQAPMTPAGHFAIAGVGLVPGPNLFAARERLGPEQASAASEEVLAISNDAPGAITGLAANVSGLGVNLTWNAGSEPDSFGYHVRRDGQDLTLLAPVTAASRIWASSSLDDLPPDWAFDGDPETAWLPAEMPAYWTIVLVEPTLVARVDLHFRGPNGPVQAPAHRIEVEWEGRLVPLLDANASGQTAVSHTFAQPFATTRVQVTLQHGNYIGLAEVSILGLAVVPAATPVFAETLPDGVHVYEVSAVDRYGARSPSSSLEVAVGDVDAPPVPTGLQASVSASDVALTWQPVSAPDLAGYVVLRDGTSIASPTAPAYTDVGRPNGMYSYSVRSRDAVGNQSAGSASATATVSVGLLPAPVLAAATPPQGCVALTWAHPGAVAFEVQRSTVSGGPYASVALTGDVREAVDCDVVPGTAYFVVVRAVDAVGNVSAPSNEVQAIPVAPRPVLLRPTDAAHPITVRASEASVGGRAWSGAVVAVTVNGELRGVGDAGSAYDEVEALGMSEGSFAPRISPEGRSVAFASNEGDGPRTHWLEWSTGVAAQAEAASQPGAFSPDGRRLTALVPVCDGAVCQTDVRLIDIDSAQVSVLEQGPIDVHETAWSPSGGRVAVAGWDTGSFGMRLAVIDVASGATTGLASTSDFFGNLRWSPGGDEIVVQRWDDGEQRLEMDVIPVLGGATLSIPDEVGPFAPAWMPEGRTIVFTSLVEGRPRLRSWDLASGSVTDVTDGSGVAVDGRIEAAGALLSYVRFAEGTPVAHALVVRDLATGLERELLEWTSDYGSTSELHDWVKGGYLAFLHEGRVRLFPSFDGAFHVPNVGLSPGSNVVEVEGIEVTTGAVSGSSLPIVVTVPSEAFPDLAVSAADLASYPTIPLVGQPSVVSARVRNVGAGPAAASSVRLSVRAPAGVLLDQTVPLGTIAPGASALVSSQWSPPAAGTYLLRAEVDPDHVVHESREDNNAADVGIFVVESGDLSIQVTADSPSYPAHTAALVGVDVTNGGAAFSGTLRTVVLTAAGALVAVVDERPLTVAYGESQHLEFAWNTGATLAGEYRFQVQARAGNEVRAEAIRAFLIAPDVEAWTRIVPADPTVGLSSTAQLGVRVENRGANTVLEGAGVRVAIAPAMGGATVFAASAPLPVLHPLGGWDGSFEWTPAAPSGSFVARVEVVAAAGSVLASASAPLEVQPATGGALRATLDLQPAHVLPGEASQATVAITNDGPGTLVSEPFAVEVTRGPDPAVLVSVPFALDIPAGETRVAVVEVPTGSLTGGAYLVFVRAVGSAASLAREALHVHAAITPPSLESPPDGGAVATPHPMLRVNNAFAAAGATLRYDFQLFRDEFLTQPLPGVSGVPETSSVTSWTVPFALGENNRYFWRARAGDGFSYSSWTPIASFLVDAANEPPAAPVPDSPAPGARVATLQPTLVVVNAADPELDPLTYDFRLALDSGMTQVVASAAGVAQGPLRTSWLVPVALVENAHYYWSARAHDAQASSSWTVPFAFQVDVDNESPTAAPLLRPAADAEIETQTPELAVGEALDPEGDALVYRIEVDVLPTFSSPEKQVSPDLVAVGGEAAWTPPVPLSDNAYGHWRASAYDGHTAGPWSERRFFVNLANDPPGGPIPLEPGAGTIVTTQTPQLRVQNAVDLDQDLLTYSFEVRDQGANVVASASGVPEAPGQTSWQVDEPLVENGAFTWRARAHDGEVYGEWSADIPFRVNSTNDPPTAPSLIAPPDGAVVAIARPELVVGNATSPDLLPLSYTFEVYRLESGGGPTLVAAIDGVPPGPASTSWVLDEDLLDGDYSWRARAADVHQPGPWMASARFTVAVDVPPAPPTGLSAVAGDGRVDLAWQASPEPDVTGYRVHRAVTSGGPYALVASSTSPSYADTGLTNGQTRYYVVTAVDATFESDPSLEVSATPMGAPLTAEVTFWPAILEGECLVCAPPAGSGGALDLPVAVQPVTPVLECVRNDDPIGVTAFFGFDNPNATSALLPIGPQNFFDPAPADRGQPRVFARGRSARYPGAFAVRLDSPLAWWLDGVGVTADPSLAVESCALPGIACAEWLYATIEPPAGHDPAAIDPSTVWLGTTVPADPAYRALVDRDGDGRMEREVRFARSGATPLLGPGRVGLAVRGSLGAHAFVGSGMLVVAEPKARSDVSPTVLSRSEPGPDPRVWLTLRGCFGGEGIDVDSIRLNGTVPVGAVLGIEDGVLQLSFSRPAVMAVLPLGDRVELVVTGRAQEQQFRATDLVRVVE